MHSVVQFMILSNTHRLLSKVSSVVGGFQDVNVYLMHLGQLCGLTLCWHKPWPVILSLGCAVWNFWGCDSILGSASFWMQESGSWASISFPLSFCFLREPFGFGEWPTAGSGTQDLLLALTEDRFCVRLETADVGACFFFILLVNSPFWCRGNLSWGVLALRSESVSAVEIFLLLMDSEFVGGLIVRCWTTRFCPLTFMIGLVRDEFVPFLATRFFMSDFLDNCLQVVLFIFEAVVFLRFLVCVPDIAPFICFLLRITSLRVLALASVGRFSVVRQLVRCMRASSQSCSHEVK